MAHRVIFTIVVLFVSVISSAQATSKLGPTPRPASMKQVGDLFLTIRECARTGDTADTAVPDFPINCAGSIENRGTVKIRVEFAGGSEVIDDIGNEYPLWVSGPWGGAIAHFSFGDAGCCAKDLIPGLPLKIAFWVEHVKRGATLVNPVLEFQTSGNPSHSQVVFKGIPIRRH